MVLPELAVAAVRRHCEQQVPPERRDELRIEADIESRSVTTVECRRHGKWHP